MSGEKETSLWEELVKFTGSEENALKLSRILDKRKDKGLTPTQQLVWDYISSGKPLGSLRQLAQACGIAHPQTLVAVLSALVMKGYLVPNKDAK